MLYLELERKMKSTKIIVVLILSFILFGCYAKLPTDVEVKSNARFGVMYLLDENPKHVHVGTTVFNNFVTTKASDWSTREILVSYTIDKLKSEYGFEAIEIEPTQKMLAQRLKLYKSKGNTYTINEDLISEFQKAIDGKDVDFLITIEPIDLEIDINSTVYSEGYGLYTRCFLKMCEAKWFHHAIARIYEMNPPRIASWSAPTRVITCSDCTVEIDWNNLKNLSSSDIDKTKEHVVTFVEKQISTAIDRLGSNSSNE